MTLSARCSMLPGWGDCARRAAAKQWPGLVTGAGFELRETLPSVGAAIGTAVHKIVEGATLGKDGTGAAVDAFNEQIAKGCEWDDRTKNAITGEAQIKSLAKAMAPHLTDLKPVLLEQKLTAGLRNGWKLTGHPDIYEETRRLTDYKTGKPWAYKSQMGAYTLLLEAHEFTVEEARVLFVPRVGPRTPQPPPSVKAWKGIELRWMKAAAYETLGRMTIQVEQFEESSDPLVIPANPMSMMCGPKYCPAWGTEFCREHESEPEEPKT